MLSRLMVLSDTPGWHYEDGIPVHVARSATSSERQNLALTRRCTVVVAALVVLIRWMARQNGVFWNEWFPIAVATMH